MSDDAPLLSVEQVSKSYAEGTAAAVENLSIDVREGEFFTLLGPSGCGKSTTLRLIAGLEAPDNGRIRLAQTLLFDAANGVNVQSHKRDIAMVFQSYAIWPHMSVFENVLFPLESLGKFDRAERIARARSALEQVGLAQFETRSSTLLSGGQQQRVALARAIVRQARLVLLDEPLSNLDAGLREQMRDELFALQKQLGATVVYVTHDQDEAMHLSDRVALMRGGHLVDLGPPRRLYLEPRTAFGAKFLGRTQLHRARIENASRDVAIVRTSFGELLVEDSSAQAGSDMLLMVRPEHVEIAPSASSKPPANSFDAHIVSVRFSGRTVLYEAAVGDQSLEAVATSSRMYEQGDKVRLHLPSTRCRLLPLEET